MPDDLLLVETDSPFLAPQPRRGKPNQPANVVATAARLPSCGGSSTRSSRRWSRRNAARVVRMVTRAQRWLGQNFLADPNLLDAIVRESGAGERTTSCSRSAVGRAR